MMQKMMAENEYNEALMFKMNQQSIEKDQTLMLRIILRIALILLPALFILSCFFAPQRGMMQLYAISYIIIGLIYLWERKRPGQKILIKTYMYFIVIFAMMIYLCIFVSRESMGSNIIALFCLMPVAVIDRTWRLDLCMTLFYLVYDCFSFFNKAPQVARDDIFNMFFMMLIGIIIGKYMLKIKLTSYELRRKSEIQKYMDYLTELYNRNKLYEILNTEYDGVIPITGIIMLDIDNFKKYNDMYGHQAGDECLKTVCRCLKECGEQRGLRVFRYGGEEMLAISDSYDYQELEKITNELISQVQAAKIPFEASSYGVVTVSGGFSVRQLDEYKDHDQLIGEADQALYHAKGSGKNKAVGYDQI